MAAVILAAGASVRLGQPKQLLRFRGETLIHRAARLACAAGLTPVHVVVGYRGAEVSAALGEFGGAVAVVTNPDWRHGMGSSLARGVASLPPVAAALVLVTDQPYLSAAVLAAVLQRYRKGPASLVACRYAGGTVGVPALFDRRHFAELAALSGARGARPLFARHAAALATVSFPEGDADVDTPAAAAALRYPDDESRRMGRNADEPVV